MGVSSSGLRRAFLGSSRPVQRRLTLLTMMAVAVTLVAVGLTGWVALRVTLFDVSERASLLIARDLVVPASQDIAATGELSDRLLGPGTTVVEAVRADGTVLRAPGETTSLNLDQRDVAAAQQHATTVRNTTSSSGKTYRVVTVPLSEPGDVLVVGGPLAPTDEILDVFGLVVLIVGSVGLVWAWLVGRVAARAALGPVLDFIQGVRRVTETGDLRPLTTRYTGGAMATLAQTFNQLLARLAASRDQQNLLVADASHELRTPLTSMRTNIELLTLDAGTGRLSAADRAKILADVHTQTVELSALVGDLLHLTRDTTPSWEPIDLRTVVQTAVERARRRAHELTFDVDLSPLDLVGDAGSLEQAVTNILDNALKWSPRGGTVRVRLDGHQLHIADEGPGIAGVDLPHVFDRFYRSEAARSTPGTGLGLAIAAKVVHDHGGTIGVSSPPDGGAHFTIRIPGAFSGSVIGHLDDVDTVGGIVVEAAGKARAERVTAAVVAAQSAAADADRAATVVQRQADALATRARKAATEVAATLSAARHDGDQETALTATHLASAAEAAATVTARETAAAAAGVASSAAAAAGLVARAVADLHIVIAGQVTETVSAVQTAAAAATEVTPPRRVRVRSA
jgi:two-component system sensor histidine kinase MprB